VDLPTASRLRRADTPICQEKIPKKKPITIAVLSRAHPPSYGSTYLSGKAVQTNRATSVDCIWKVKMTKYKVHFEARCPDTSSVMSPIITVEADSQYMARELAEAKFKSQYPHARNYNLSAKKIEQI
jgi:hypothetical protein